MAFDAEDILLLSQLDDCGGKGVSVGHLGQVDHDAVEILMLMVVMPVMVRGAGGKVIFRRGAKAKDHARVNDAFGHRQHRDSAGHLGGDHRAGGGKARFASEVGLGKKNQVGTQDLVFEDLGQRGLMVQRREAG